jgi:hypothetical protein
MNMGSQVSSPQYGLPTFLMAIYVVGAAVLWRAKR